MSKPDPILANVLKSLRLQRGVSQENLAIDSNVTISAMSRIERGLSNPSWTSVIAIARALKIGLDELAIAVMSEQRQAPAGATAIAPASLPPHSLTPRRHAYR